MERHHYVGTRYPSTGDLTPTTAYQYYAVVVTAIWPSNHQTFALSEFELFCQPSEIEEFKLYGSPDNSSWTEIHAQTSANITSSGTDFTITNPGSYQHYGLVVTKNYGYHNVSLAEMKLEASQTVDLTNYYNKAELDPRIAKAKGTFLTGVDGTGNGNGLTFLNNEYRVFSVTRSHYNGINATNVWGNLATNLSIYEHTVTFEPGVFNDDDDYVVLLTANSTGAALYGANRVMSLDVKEKHHTHFITTCMVYEDNLHTNHPWGFEFVVF